MKEEDLERLKLPLMSPETENEDSSAPTLTITVDAKSGTCTGVSASDRAKTVLALSSPETKPEDFRRPGHVFPLKYRNGGVLRRAGHTEAYVDLVMLAGLPPVSVLSAIIDPDGSIVRSFDGPNKNRVYGLSNTTAKNLWSVHSVLIVGSSPSVSSTQSEEFIALKQQYQRLSTDYDQLHQIVIEIRSKMGDDPCASFWLYSPGNNQPPSPPPPIALPLF
ncbi:monofunctional riboflavin biosynthesis protein RIBA 3, chloroplastic-like [Populus alba]|uniref:monofunctional riboflavin biosynthesis protein RIBA 3, chloroplastic-like n=1 Tax=Populus alba TaxID=43335 RepID=UPI003CC6F18D